MDEKLFKTIGTGWSFPPSFSKDTRSVRMVSGEEEIAQSIKIIIFTKVGERLFHPNFGTDLDSFLYELNVNSLIITRIQQMVEDAIYNYEPRVDVDDVDVRNDFDNNSIEISVSYTIKGNDTQNNLVFPFYLEDNNNK